jgi:hypothetical protein
MTVIKFNGKVKMCSILFDEMPRRTRTFKLDDRVLDALERLAQKQNASVNRYLENLLFSHAKAEGEIPMGAMPLGDPRGGKRENSGRPRKDGSNGAKGEDPNDLSGQD